MTANGFENSWMIRGISGKDTYKYAQFTTQEHSDGAPLHLFSFPFHSERSYRVYVDFNECIDRDDVDNGYVFKTYKEFNRAVEKAANEKKDSSKAFRSVLDGSIFFTLFAGFFSLDCS